MNNKLAAPSLAKRPLSVAIQINLDPRAAREE